MRLIKVTIGGKQFEGDFANPDVLERCEKAIDKAFKEATQIEEFEIDSQAVRHQCNAICKCADEILGEGSSARLFPDGADLLSCLEVYKELCEMKVKQVVPLINEKRKKYSLERAQRVDKHANR